MHKPTTMLLEKNSFVSIGNHNYETFVSLLLASRAQPEQVRSNAVTPKVLYVKIKENTTNTRQNVSARTLHLSRLRIPRLECVDFCEEQGVNTQ